MGIQIQGNTGIISEVGGTAFRALHTHAKPLEHGALGHYRVNHRAALVNVQAANSRLFEFRNAHASNFLVPTRLMLKWVQTSPHTAAIEDSIDCFKVTSFTVLDTVNTVTPVGSIRRNNMAAFPGNAQIRGVTVAGAAAGMTGGTLTKDGGAFFQLPQFLLVAVPTASVVIPIMADALDIGSDTHPFVLAPNEGIIIENRALLGAAAGSMLYVDMSWAEVTAY